MRDKRRSHHGSKAPDEPLRAFPPPVKALNMSEFSPSASRGAECAASMLMPGANP
ncbi:hypothetical protein D779_3235 [Imhoffiella purpurea]|uniref:Uncharacterized protein n=1 Tax=Imhoffiella purpurea TaxID=1249627 RepID=W9VCW6_9GAMM|nr:hypothetical protein D779_3235 [Imhoffiella purpurea]